MSDWNPAHYAQFSDVRMRPALDLLARVPDLPPGAVIDLGCGNGSIGPALKQRFDRRDRMGVDNSPAMLTAAMGTGAYTATMNANINTWDPETPPALIYSNAALHWLPDLASLLPRLAGKITPGGTLAVQVPHQNGAPSHRLWLDLVQTHFPGRFDPAKAPGIPETVEFFDILNDLGTLSLWETEYYQHLPAQTQGHPVRQFTSSTFARPVLDVLAEDEQTFITTIYDEAVSAAYPLRPDGTALFPFRRLFFTLTLPT
ncbi:methyltransferase domain-containing protein [Pseudooceanicola sp. C21-150M6]|uniref:methyltransferase domain-containing protein n=1 Tax=Pseudooceanicola sp. C21-150M6 TaxID=3434355 RepID=UPI003D7F4A5F